MNTLLYTLYIIAGLTFAGMVTIYILWRREERRQAEYQKWKRAMRRFN